MLRRRDDRPHRNILELADSLESIAYLSPFNRELMFVIDVLIRAAAAPAEIRTLWFYAMRRKLLYIGQFRFGELLFLAHDLGGNDLALNRVRNKDGFTLCPADAFPTESDVFDLQIDKAHIINIKL